MHLPRSALLALALAALLPSGASATTPPDPTPMAIEILTAPAAPPPATAAEIIPVFYLERTDLVRVELRRWTFSSVHECVGRTDGCGCDAVVIIESGAPAPTWAAGDVEHNGWRGYRPDVVPDNDPRWPEACATCGDAFDDPACPDCRDIMSSSDGVRTCASCGYSECGGEAERQVHVSLLFSGAPDGRLYTTHDAAVGAAWDEPWLHAMGERYVGADGLSLWVKTPGGAWHVDGPSSACGRPGKVHKCWTRHGDPREPGALSVLAGAGCTEGCGTVEVGDYRADLQGGKLIRRA